MRRPLRVMKFGGTSVGDAECIERAAKIVAAASGQGAVVVVVSAMSGVTNRLIEAAHRSQEGRQEEVAKLTDLLRIQHETALRTLIRDETRRAQVSGAMEQVIAETARLLQGTALLRELTPRARDAISSAGERLATPLVAGALCRGGARCGARAAARGGCSPAPHRGAAPPLRETPDRAPGRPPPLRGGCAE